MPDRRLSRGFRACVLLCASVSLPSIVRAQLAGEIALPERLSVDDNDVNVTTGTYREPVSDLTIGSGNAAVKGFRIYGRPEYTDAYIDLSYYPVTGQVRTINMGRQSKNFTVTSASYPYTYQSTNNSSATFVGSGNVFTLTAEDGTVYTYDYVVGRKEYYPTQGYSFFNEKSYLSTIKYPNGKIEKINWVTKEYCTLAPYDTQNVPQFCYPKVYNYNNRAPAKLVSRVQSISNNAGYQIHYQYALDGISQYYTPTQAAEAVSWQNLAGAKGINTLVEACSPTAGSCATTGAWPSVSYNRVITSTTDGYVMTDDITDALSRTFRYTKKVGSSDNYEAVKRPGSASDNIRVNQAPNGTVTSVVRDGATWTYAYGVSGNVSTLTVTDPTSRVRKYTSDLAVGLPTRIEDEYGRAIVYTYDSGYRLATATTPDGQLTTNGYNTRGNVTGTVVTQKGGGATLSTSATYPPTCSNAVTCNAPISTTDARGQVTTYAYDATHGGVTSVTAPAVGGVSPQTRYGYTQVGGVWLPTSVSACRTTASCAGTADEVKSTTSYNANLLPTSVTRGAGDGSLSAVTAATYTSAGDVSTVDGPLAGSADTTRYYYDVARQGLGVVGPDPDGAGARLNRAVRIGYDGWGRATTASLGTATDQSDSALANMTVLQVQTATLDDAGRTKSIALSAGSTTYSRVDYSYDAAGRGLCTAVRMNPSALGSAGNACTVGADAGLGPDRVSLTQYSAAGIGQPVWTSVTSAYGTPEATTETIAQTVNGKTASVTDGNGNLTTYEYDGFDRLAKTRYPSPTTSGSSSTTDYEQLGYDPNGNVTSRRLRDGQSIGLAYDTLNRLITKDLPGTEPDVSYSYDLLGRITGASTSAQSLAWSYDALNRLTVETQPFGSSTSQYDAAGRRTRLTWNDGFYVTYDYLTTGEVSAIRENGAASGVGVLASYAYDDLGRRTVLYRGNATETDYGYDAVSRLATLTNNLGATAHDVTTTFTYTPASQIASSTRSNDAYAWNGFYSVDRPYTVNGLNQLTAAGTTSLGYDARGNLTSSGSSSYTYSSENLMKTSPSATLYYDAAGRLTQYDPTVSTRFVYDGAHLTSEVANPSGSIQRRYVYGPGDDEPLVWYEGSGTTDRRWLYADERGSVTAVANASGNAIALNSYDEYGIPASGNLGRFQYTGQAWLPELGMSYYKARIYSPTLGRFMQTDPIGYGDGINWYNYVGSDPINATDPSGLLDVPAGSNGASATCPAGESKGTQDMPCLPDDIIIKTKPYEKYQIPSIMLTRPALPTLTGVSGWGLGNSTTPQRTQPAPKPKTNVDRQPDGKCPSGSYDSGRGGCLTQAGKDEQDKNGCRAFGIPLLAGAIVFGGPEIVAGRAILSSPAARLLAGTSLVQSIGCF